MTVKIFGRLEPRTFKNCRKFQIWIQENYFDWCPRPIKKVIYKPYLKEILMDKYGPEAFLFPETMMFPVVNINTGQVDARLVQYALIRSIALRRISRDFDYIFEKAKAFYEENKEFCKPYIITLTDTGQQINLVDYLLELDERGGRDKFEIPDDVNDPKPVNPHKKHWHASRFKRLKIAA